MPATARPSEPKALLAAPVDVPARSKRCAHACTRRRTKPYSIRRRTLHAPEPLPVIHPFDQLPWIPALDATPCDRWDIADLSQLPDSRPGLIARRLLPDLIQTPPARPSTPPPPPQPPCDTHPHPRPTTPLSRFVPSRVLFHNLMPVLCESGNDSACTSSPLQLLN